MTEARPQTTTWRNRLFVSLQYFLPQHALTRGVGWFMSRESDWLKNTQIKALCRLFDINTEEAAKPVPEGYANLNEFFTRELKPGARDLSATPDDALMSPCDGAISECGRIENGSLIQAKGFRYSVAELLQDDGLAPYFDGGLFMTIYLAPYDYHRVHFPVAGTIERERHIPGKLFSVNGATAAAVPRLFARNERREFIIGNETSKTALVMVGALNVGSISTPWETSPLVAGSKDDVTTLPAVDNDFQRGDLLGWFNMGSTVILLLPKSETSWRDDLKAGDKVRLGQPLTA
ncbi:MAG: archaetidylserine decarboxylase [Woeseiaceae bacterium]